MKRTLLALSLALAMVLGACTDPDTARRVLAQQGYTDVEINGYEFFGCSQDDTYATGFVATSPAGIPVTGVVCSAWLKGATVRIF